jgi:RNA polymerase sigma-70 factor, ECF subfamily
MSDDVQRELPHLLPRLWRFALRLAREPHDAQDLVQRTCLRALERRAQWQPGSALLSWLFAIEHSIWVNELRTPQRRKTASLDTEDPWLEARAEAPASANPELQLHYAQVVRAVEALPEAQRVVMMLVAVEGMSYREAAEILAVPIGTVMSRLARARLAVGQQFLDRPAAHTSPRQGASP